MKAKKLLCLTVPHQSRMKTFEKNRVFYFPLGLAYIIQAIERELSDYHIDILDFNFESFEKKTLRDFISKTYDDGQLPEYVMFGAMSTNYKAVKTLTQMIKSVNPNLKIICGGSVSTLHSKYLLEHLGIDICVLGEGEETIIELLENQNNLANVQGVAFLDKIKNYIQIPGRQRTNNIIFDYTVYKRFNIEGYIERLSLRAAGIRSFMVHVARGCFYDCSFCYRPYGSKMFYRPVKDAVNELLWLKENYNINHFSLNYELMWDKKWIRGFAESLIEKSVKMTWNAGARVNEYSDKDYELLCLMKKSGLLRMAFGMESASKKILTNMGKTGVTAKASEDTIRLFRNVGIKPCASIVMGFPGENKETMGETVKFLRKNLLTMKNFFILQPFPGTPVYENYVKEKVSEEEWLENYAHDGDASNLQINLTELSDEEFHKHLRKAEKQVQSQSIYHWFRYYKISEIPEQGLIDLYRYIKMKFTGAHFGTP